MEHPSNPTPLISFLHTIVERRYFWDARFMTTTFDANPKTLTELNRLLRDDEAVLRYFTDKVPTNMARVTAKNYKNPYGDDEKVETA